MGHRLLFTLVVLLSVKGAAGITHQAYVWQRDWSPALKDAIETHAEELDGLTVLFAEFDSSEESGVSRIPVDFDALKVSGLPITLALRMNRAPRTGVAASFENGPTRFIEYTLRAAENHGLKLAGVEIDFDCPTSKLGDYATSLTQLKAKLDDTPLSITTLPTWMSRPSAFARLVEVTDRFVLQVHSIKRPRSYADEVVLCDPSESLRWAREASRFGKPFRIALPTYTYRIAFDSGDRLAEVSSEDASAVQRPDWRYRFVHADPKTLLELVQTLNGELPDHCTGLI